MFPTIDISTNLREFERGLSVAAREQVPFAAAQAINRLAELAVAQEQKNEAEVLDRPRPFTKNAIRISRASKSRPAAFVFMMDKTAEYLRPYEFGGLNKLNSKVLLKPVGAKEALDQYGNLPRRYMEQMKGRKDVFVGEVQTKRGPVFGLWQRHTEEGKGDPVKVRRDGTVRVMKAARSFNHSGGLKLLVKFDEAHPARQRLDWFGVAERVVKTNFSAEMRWALNRAFAK